MPLIRVNTLTPGYVRTSPTQKTLKIPGVESVWSEENMLNRVSTPDEYRAPVVFMLGDGSNFMTGADLRVDGGHCAWRGLVGLNLLYYILLRIKLISIPQRKTKHEEWLQSSVQDFGIWPSSLGDYADTPIFRSVHACRRLKWNLSAAVSFHDRHMDYFSIYVESGVFCSISDLFEGMILELSHSGPI